MSDMLRNKAIKLLTDLISIPSLSGMEYEVSEYIYEYLSSMGLNPVKHEVYKGGYNVVVELGKGGESILIESHMDVVPAWDMEDAFKPVVEGDIVRGRGACDTKGGLVSTLLALEKLIDREGDLDNRLIFAYVVDEELYGRGAKELLIRDVKADYGIVIEPTNLTISVSIAGCIEFIIESYGVSGHGASTVVEGNAVENLIKLLIELRRHPILSEEGGLRYMKNILNIGKISGGESAWMIPSYAKAELLLHFIPIHSFNEVWDMLSSYIDEVGERVGGRFKLSYIHGCDGYILNRGDSFIRRLEDTARKLFGVDDVLSHMPSESDANELYHKGGIKAIVFGPGDINYAHSSREYVKVDDVLMASEFLVKAFT